MRFFLKCVEEMWNVKGNNKIKGFDKLFKSWKKQFNCDKNIAIKQMSVFLNVSPALLLRFFDYERIEENDENKE